MSVMSRWIFEATPADKEWASLFFGERLFSYLIRQFLLVLLPHHKKRANMLRHFWV